MTNATMAVTGPLPAAFARRLEPMSHTVTGLPIEAGILLKHGQVATSVRLAPKNLRGPLGYCFANTARALAPVALKDDRWKYCEGYVYDPKHDVLFEHAWLLDPDDTAWETTWTDTTNRFYLGLPFDLREIVALLEDSEEPLLFGDWDRGFRVLRSHRDCCGRVVPDGASTGGSGRSGT